MLSTNEAEVSPCTHDLAVLLPILYSVSRVNAYLKSQHHMNVPTINCLCHGLQTGRTQWLCYTVDLRCPGLILQPMLHGSVIPELYTKGKARTPTAQVPVRSLTSAAHLSQLKHAPAAKKITQTSNKKHLKM